jgi:hypothetical protein
MLLTAALGIASPIGAETVTFDEYPQGTVITNQYVHLGVLFSGHAGSSDPEIFDYGPESHGRVLINNWWDPMKISFVNPTNPDEYCPVSEIEFDNPIDVEVDYIVIQVYNSAGTLIHEETSTSPERVVIDLGGAIGAYMVLDDAQDTAYVIDNLFFARGPSPVEAETWGEVKRLFK